MLWRWGTEGVSDCNTGVVTVNFRRMVCVIGRVMTMRRGSVTISYRCSVLEQTRGEIRVKIVKIVVER